MCRRCGSRPFVAGGPPRSGKLPSAQAAGRSGSRRAVSRNGTVRQRQNSEDAASGAMRAKGRWRIMVCPSPPRRLPRRQKKRPAPASLAGIQGAHCPARSRPMPPRASRVLAYSPTYNDYKMNVKHDDSACQSDSCGRVSAVDGGAEFPPRLTSPLNLHHAAGLGYSPFWPKDSTACQPIVRALIRGISAANARWDPAPPGRIADVEDPGDKIRGRVVLRALATTGRDHAYGA
jgi:hypothetical protein